MGWQRHPGGAFVRCDGVVGAAGVRLESSLSAGSWINQRGDGGWTVIKGSKRVCRSVWAGAVITTGEHLGEARLDSQNALNAALAA